MNNPMIHLIILAAIAIFLILRLKNVLGTREGFEPPKVDQPAANRARFEVIEGSADEGDHDIADHADPDGPAGQALAAMKRAEPSFHVGQFLGGAKQAYEMILMAFENGNLDDVRPFLSDEVAQAFQGVIDNRAANGHSVEAQFIGVRETALAGAEFDGTSGLAEISVRFVGELIVATRDADGTVIAGDPKSASKQRDVWTFARKMGQADPNWRLVATG